MNTDSIIGLIVIFAFYGSYFTKMFVQGKSGIKTDRMGRGNKPKKTFVIALLGIIIFNLIFACFSILLLHLQILEEEKYLPTVFGKNYLEYKKKTRRYFGTM